MATLDDVLGIHAQTLSFRAQRAEVLANNLANADTPNFLARDLDFKTFLQEAQDGSALTRTDSAHLSEGNGVQPGLLYRIPMQPAIDGNTVDGQLEKSEFMQNAVRYQASLTLLDGRIRGLIKALRGE